MMQSETMIQHGFSNDNCVEMNGGRKKCYYMKHIYCRSGYLTLRLLMPHTHTHTHTHIYIYIYIYIYMTLVA